MTAASLNQRNKPRQSLYLSDETVRVRDALIDKFSDKSLEELNDFTFIQSILFIFGLITILTGVKLLSANNFINEENRKLHQLAEHPGSSNDDDGSDGDEFRGEAESGFLNTGDGLEEAHGHADHESR